MWEVFIAVLVLGAGFFIGREFVSEFIFKNYISKVEAESQCSELESEIDRLEGLLNEAKKSFKEEKKITEQLRNQIESLRKKVIVGASEEINLSVKALSNFV